MMPSNVLEIIASSEEATIEASRLRFSSVCLVSAIFCEGILSVMGHGLGDLRLSMLNGCTGDRHNTGVDEYVQSTKEEHVMYR